MQNSGHLSAYRWSHALRSDQNVTQDIKSSILFRKIQKTADTKNALNYSNAHTGLPKTELDPNEISRNFISTKDACFACDVCTQTVPRKKTVCVIM